MTAKPVERQQQRRELLADLVVQFSSDAAPFVLLRDEQPHRAGAPLAFEAVGHRVEACGERVELRVGHSPANGLVGALGVV